MKNCSRCKKTKKDSDFYNSKKSKSKLSYSCKECRSLSQGLYYKTKIGLCALIYKSQCSSSKSRGHDKPNYTKEELKNWILSRHNFNELYTKWVVSGYKQDLKPSIDRFRDNEGYSFSNIKLGTWMENRQDQYDKSSKGIIGNKLRPITQSDLDGNKIKDFMSINEAVREVGLAQGNLWKVLNGIGQTLGGYKWNYTN